ncbi:hypothetical protein ACO0QE_004229 [Hanseniaspora vineae]
MLQAAQLKSDPLNKEQPSPDESKNPSSHNERNQLTVKNFCLDVLEAMFSFTFDPEMTAGIMIFFVILESLALKLIVRNVAYTEIDYKAYMEQISMIFDEKITDYSQIKGGTGPLVYPAGHVLLFRAMRNITQGMENIKEGQVIFRYLYLVSMVVDYAIYSMLDNVPPFAAVLFCLSKRLHSIYVLRLFNDCFTTLFVSICCFLFILCGKHYKKLYKKENSGFIVLLNVLGVLCYSFAISIKMNALLYLPGVLVILVWMNYNSKRFLLKMLLYVCCGVQLQISLASTFLAKHSSEYWNGAFNFQRKFMYKWSINWQFVEESVFLGDYFSKGLLLLHAFVLLFFIVRKWIQPVLITNKITLWQFVSKILTLNSELLFPTLNAQHVGYILVTSNYIGVVFSRSLHYQFLSWYHWTLPILFTFAWGSITNTSSETKKNVNQNRISKQQLINNAKFLVKSCAWFALHEYCWEVYPPSKFSSALLQFLNVILLYSVYANYNFNFSHKQAQLSDTEECTSFSSKVKVE